MADSLDKNIIGEGNSFTGRCPECKEQVTFILLDDGRGYKCSNENCNLKASREYFIMMKDYIGEVD